jgi:hypothetical protein
MSAPQNGSPSWWPPLVARTKGLRKRPLLVHLGSLLRLIPFRPLEINCLYFLEYNGIPQPQPGAVRGRAELRSATVEDLEQLRLVRDLPQTFRRRFQAGDDCAVAVVDGRIVAYQWFCAKAFYLEERYGYKIEVPPDSIYEYDVFILPDYRLAGIWFKFHCVYLRELMERLRRRRIIGLVDYGNRLAMNTHLRFGFRLFRRVVVIRILGKSFFVERDLGGDSSFLPRWVAKPRAPQES